MVSIYSRKVDIQDEISNIIEFRGKSTDSKPTELEGKEVGNGSSYIEMDTGKVYFYDAENNEWIEFTA